MTSNNYVSISDLPQADDASFNWTWVDGSTSTLPGRYNVGDLAELVAYCAMGNEMDGGWTTRLYRIEPDVWITESGASEEESTVAAFRSTDLLGVLSGWIVGECAFLHDGFDLCAAATAHLLGLVPASEMGVDVAVFDDTLDGESIRQRWTALFVEFDAPHLDPADLDDLRGRLAGSSPWVAAVLAGEQEAVAGWRGRIDAFAAWEASGFTE